MIYLVFTRKTRLAPACFDNYYEADTYRSEMLSAGEGEVFLIERPLGGSNWCC